MSDQAKANAIQDSSLASTQNMKRLLVEVDTNKHFEPVLVCCEFFFKTQKLLGSCKLAAR